MAHQIRDRGYPCSTIILDDRWETHMGELEFSDDFPEHEGMISELLSLGFEVWFWVTPFVNEDAATFRPLTQERILVPRRNDTGAAPYRVVGRQIRYRGSDQPAEPHLVPGAASAPALHASKLVQGSPKGGMNPARFSALCGTTHLNLNRHTRLLTSINSGRKSCGARARSRQDHAAHLNFQPANGATLGQVLFIPEAACFAISRLRAQGFQFSFVREIADWQPPCIVLFRELSAGVFPLE